MATTAKPLSWAAGLDYLISKLPRYSARESVLEGAREGLAVVAVPR